MYRKLTHVHSYVYIYTYIYTMHMRKKKIICETNLIASCKNICIFVMLESRMLVNKVRRKER